MSHEIGDSQREGFDTIVLSSPTGVEVEFAPAAGMVGCSLRHRGDELLGQRSGLAAYARDGHTMGIPLLHPWANRLARYGYELDGQRIDIDRAAPGVHDDGAGLPIHGLLAGSSEWVVGERSADAEHARFSAEIDLAALPRVMALFPFPHRLRMDVALRGGELRIETTVEATGGIPVPIALGYHPYFQLPDVPRSEWEVELAVRTRALLDSRCLPTGRTEPSDIESGRLGSRVLDDLFPELEPDPVFSLSGGSRRIEVAYGPDYPVAVVYAPANDDVVCFEPMTAPTNPFDGGADLFRVAPGERFRAGFSIRVVTR